MSTAFWARWYGASRNNMKVFVGIDTSCYTTSVAALDADGSLLADARIPLTVKPGGRGLAQSEMVFQHVRNLPAVMSELREAIGPAAEVAAVGVSTRPRPVTDSYMPVFLAGAGMAGAVGAALNCPVFNLSHQENHILAGLWSAGGDFPSDFLAVHASGGTTEILKVRQRSDGLELELIGGTNDLHAGQFVDRVGVALGLPFPAGPHLETLAEQYIGEEINIPVSVIGSAISLSGPESHVRRWLKNSPEPAAVAAAVQRCIAESLRRAVTAALDVTQTQMVLLVGGVSANRFIRTRLATELGRLRRAAVRWPAPEYSGDNAVGAAWWARNRRVVL